MKLSVHSIQKTLFEGEVEKLIAKTASGEITVLDGHVPLISALVGPEISIVDKQGKVNKIKVGSGFLEVRPENEAIILAS